MKMVVTIATDADAPAITTLRNAANDDLAQRHRIRASCITENSTLRAIATSRVLAARSGGQIVATLRLATKKPWAIDIAYFTPVGRALYLHDIAVHPDRQGSGIGRMLVEDAKAQALAWPAQSIRFDAYDAAPAVSTRNADSPRSDASFIAILR